MKRYEIQDANGKRKKKAGPFSDDVHAVNVVNWLLEVGYYKRLSRPFRLVRIEEETPQEADTARLDWMEKAGPMLCRFGKKQTFWTLDCLATRHESARAAIDHARGYAPKVTVIKEYT